ncbi:hypothetical protein V8C86DRAFT_3142143 [Haematococcus lacustris]
MSSDEADTVCGLSSSRRSTSRGLAAAAAAAAAAVAPPPPPLPPTPSQRGQAMETWHALPLSLQGGGVGLGSSTGCADPLPGRKAEGGLAARHSFSDTTGGAGPPPAAAAALDPCRSARASMVGGGGGGPGGAAAGALAGGPGLGLGPPLPALACLVGWAGEEGDCSHALLDQACLLAPGGEAASLCGSASGGQPAAVTPLRGSFTASHAAAAAAAAAAGRPPAPHNPSSPHLLTPGLDSHWLPGSFSSCHTFHKNHTSALGPPQGGQYGPGAAAGSAAAAAAAAAEEAISAEEQELISELLGSPRAGHGDAAAAPAAPAAAGGGQPWHPHTSPPPPMYPPQPQPQHWHWYPPPPWGPGHAGGAGGSWAAGAPPYPPPPLGAGGVLGRPHLLVNQPLAPRPAPPPHAGSTSSRHPRGGRAGGASALAERAGGEAVSRSGSADSLQTCLPLPAPHGPPGSELHGWGCQALALTPPASYPYAWPTPYHMSAAAHPPYHMTVGLAGSSSTAPAAAGAAAGGGGGWPGAWGGPWLGAGAGGVGGLLPPPSAAALPTAGHASEGQQASQQALTALALPPRPPAAAATAQLGDEVGEQQVTSPDRRVGVLISTKPLPPLNQLTRQLWPAAPPPPTTPPAGCGGSKTAGLHPTAVAGAAAAAGGEGATAEAPTTSHSPALQASLTAGPDAGPAAGPAATAAAAVGDEGMGAGRVSVQLGSKGPVRLCLPLLAKQLEALGHPHCLCTPGCPPTPPSTRPGLPDQHPMPAAGSAVSAGSAAGSAGSAAAADVKLGAPGPCSTRGDAAVVGPVADPPAAAAPAAAAAQLGLSKAVGAQGQGPEGCSGACGSSGSELLNTHQAIKALADILLHVLEGPATAAAAAAAAGQAAGLAQGLVAVRLGTDTQAGEYSVLVALRADSQAAAEAALGAVKAVLGPLLC